MATGGSDERVRRGGVAHDPAPRSDTVWSRSLAACAAGWRECRLGVHLIVDVSPDRACGDDQVTTARGVAAERASDRLQHVDTKRSGDLDTMIRRDKSPDRPRPADSPASPGMCSRHQASIPGDGGTPMDNVIISGAERGARCGVTTRPGPASLRSRAGCRASRCRSSTPGHRVRCCWTRSPVARRPPARNARTSPSRSRALTPRRRVVGVPAACSDSTLRPFDGSVVKTTPRRPRVAPGPWARRSTPGGAGSPDVSCG